VGESLRGQSDAALLEFARQEDRMIITSDLDFGELIYQQHLASRGLVLARIEQLPIDDRIRRLKAIWSVVEANPIGKLVVVTDRKVRVTALPIQPDN
jgi:hypothetical protein